MAPTVGRNKSDDVLLLMLPLHSCLQFEFADRSIKVDDGNLCLIDMRETHLGRATQSIDMIGLPIPRDLLERRIRITKQVTNRPIAVQGDAEVLASYIRAIIQSGPSTMSPMARTITRDHALDLIALALGKLAGEVPKLASPEQVAMRKVRAAIENQLTNPNANRQRIAAEAGFSERHCNRLLAQEGTSIRQLLIERRLAKCSEALGNPQQSHRSISDIACDYGFRQLNDFANAFMQHYGVSPVDYRHHMASVRFQMRK
jgi:AraC family transcriptional regulator, positive regulator of tynA and feaB